MGRHLLRRKALLALAIWLSLGAPVASYGQNAAVVVPENNPVIERYVSLYVSEGRRRWLAAVVDRASFYVDHILASLQRRGMPPELVFLPVVESAYLVDAVSVAGAVGLWQLTSIGIHGTGLIVDDFVDERRDFWKSTEVALNILQYNYDQLGTWELALAAYNAGITRVKQLVTRAGTSDYWELRSGGYLPPETAEFVPQFYAAVEVYRRRAEFDLQVTMAEPSQWTRVGVPRAVHLPTLSRVAGVPLESLRTSNRELNFLVTPAWGAREVASMDSHSSDAADLTGYWLKVPTGQADALAQTLGQSNLALIASALHVVSTGDTLWGLARHYGSRVNLIESYNPGLRAASLRIGRAVVVPLLGEPVPPPTVVGTRQPLTLKYTIEPGDTLWGLSRRFGTTAERLAQGNDRAIGALLHPGDVLLVPAAEHRL